MLTVWVPLKDQALCGNTILIILSDLQRYLAELQKFTIKNRDNLQENPSAKTFSSRFFTKFAWGPVPGSLVITNN